MASLRKLDLNLVRVFITVYNTRTLKEAAITLNVTQPAVSNALKRLSDSLGQILFVRNGRGIVPTTAGRNIYEKIKLPYEHLLESLTAAESYCPKNSTRTFRISLSSYFDIFMPELAKIIEKQAPNVTIERVPHCIDTSLNETARGTLDLLLSTKSFSDKNLSKHELGFDTMVMVARHQHPAIAQEKISTEKPLADALRFSSLSRSCELAMPAYATLEEHNASVYMRTATFKGLIDIVSTTDYVAMIPEVIAKASKRDVQIFPAPYPSPTIPLELLWAKDQDEDSGNIWLRDIISQLVSQKNSTA